MLAQASIRVPRKETTFQTHPKQPVSSNYSKENKLLNTHVDLEHVVVLLLGDEGLLEDGDVPLVVGVLLLDRLHLGLHLDEVLLLAVELLSHVLELQFSEKREAQ